MTEIIEVIAAGPQGPPGKSTKDLVLSSTTVQVVPIHDGLEATEITILFDDVTTEDLSFVNGEVTVLSDITLSQTVLELSVTKGGGQVANLTMWTEFSTDSGATWLVRPDSLKSAAVGSDSEGFQLYNNIVGSPPSIGDMVRFKVTNTGAGIISITPTTSVVASKGTVDGFSTKLSMLYRLA